MEEGQPERLAILVISLDNLGDLVFASALIPPLREQFPDARVGVWCKSYSRGLVPLIPGVDETYASDPFWDRSPGGRKGSLREFLPTLMRVRAARFDKAIVFSAPWRTAAAAALAGIPMRVGLERRRNRKWLTHVLLAEDRSKPVLEEVARLLEPFGIHTKRLVYRLDARHLARENEIVRAATEDESYVAIHPFAGSEKRCVALEEWIEVANEVALNGLRVIWVGTQQELRRLKAAERGAHWVFSDDIDSGALTTTCVAISRARMFIGHDSGPMHVAAALGVPTLGVFAPGEPARTFPQGSGEWRIISRRSPGEITAEHILSEANALL